jgi:O-acetylserine/cysteine efflux transporter
VRRRDFAWGVAAAFLWGATFPFTAAALKETPPIFFACLRFLAAGGFLFFVPRPAVPWPKLVALGLLLGAGQYGLLFLAMTNGISAALASLLIHSQAFFTIVIAMLVYGERLRAYQIAAMALALAGLGCLAVNRAEGGALVGLVLVLLGALSAACGNNLLKSLGAVPMLGVTVWMSLAVPLPLFALSVVFEADGAPLSLFASLSWVTLAAVAYSALAATLLCFSIWGRLLVTYSAAQVMPFFLLVPVFGIALSVWLLGETLNALQIAGSLLIFAGLTLALLPGRARRSSRS